MADDQKANTESEDGLSKEFDEIVTHSEEVPATDEGAVAVNVRRDSTPEPVVPEPKVAPVPLEIILPETPAPVEASAKATADAPARSTGGTMVLQWLSYAFWGWFGVAMGWLLAVTINYFISGNSSNVASSLAYPLASVIVMYILAVVTDLWYSRREPAHKAGGANAIMLVHVVVFVLIGVGAAVTALFSLISMVLNSDPTMGTDGQVITAWTSLGVLFVFGFTALRIMFGGRKPKLRIVHWVLMSVVAIGVIATSLFGPVVGAQTTKDDRLIEEGLPVLVQSVSQYVSENDKLPTTLGQANSAYAYATAASNSLVSRNLVRYTPNVIKPITISGGTSEPLLKDGTDAVTYYYRVCVTFNQAKKASGTYSDTIGTSLEGYYPSYLSITSHAKGEVCYNRSANSGYGGVYPLDGSSSTSGSATTKQ